MSEEQGARFGLGGALGGARGAGDARRGRLLIVARSSSPLRRRRRSGDSAARTSTRTHGSDHLQHPAGDRRRPAGGCRSSTSSAPRTRAATACGRSCRRRRRGAAVPRRCRRLDGVHQRSRRRLRRRQGEAELIVAEASEECRAERKDEGVKFRDEYDPAPGETPARACEARKLADDAASSDEDASLRAARRRLRPRRPARLRGRDRSTPASTRCGPAC